MQWVNGTTWASTDDFMMTKVIFENGEAEVYEAFRKDGNWGTPQKCKCKVSERRDGITGKKHMSIDLYEIDGYSKSDPDYAFDPCTGEFSKQDFLFGDSYTGHAIPLHDSGTLTKGDDFTWD